MSVAALTVMKNDSWHHYSPAACVPLTPQNSVYVQKKKLSNIPEMPHMNHKA